MGMTEQFILEHRNDDVRALALGHHHEGVDIQYALTQIEGWQIACRKVPDWAAADGIRYPRHLSLEQCTSQYVAQYKARFIDGLLGNGFTMADLTGGMGVDCHFMSRHAAKVCYNEPDAGLAAITAANFNVLGRQDISVSNLRAEDFVNQCLTDGSHFNLAYLDPSRRSSGGGRLVSIGDCQPDVRILQNSLCDIADHVMVKLSPMLDLRKALSELGHVSNVLVLSLAGECKEMTLVMRKGFEGEPVITATDLDNTGVEGMAVSDTLSGYMQPAPVIGKERVVEGTFIYEPHASIMKAALFKRLAVQTGTCQLHGATHLFWSDRQIPDFPGRQFRLLRVIPFDKRNMGVLMKCRANVATRNFPLTASQLQQRLKISDGGQRYLYGVTLADSSRVILDLDRIKA